MGELADLEMSGRVKRKGFGEVYRNTDTLVRRGGHVILMYDTIMHMTLDKLFSETGRCDFYKLRGHLMPKLNGMIVPKDSPLLYPLNDKVLAMTEAGLYNYWIKSALPNYTYCLNPPSKISISSSLYLSNLWGIFVVLAGGYFLSLLSFCLEIVCGVNLHLGEEDPKEKSIA
ncbi:uncharacterized protein LOC121873988 [Homarus americanus]|uniref:uncharacterized protein LOC121873988 n=1 Tax=Homarus americanus TaxID=6706 RepID=UPI001C458161|nr:uncharacterized protein LOC121873988 [Homarus americanus]